MPKEMSISNSNKYETRIKGIVGKVKTNQSSRSVGNDPVNHVFFTLLLKRTHRAIEYSNEHNTFNFVISCGISRNAAGVGRRFTYAVSTPWKG